MIFFHRIDDIFIVHSVLKNIEFNIHGVLAQLGERLLCTQEVSGSIPLGSIESKDSSIVH